MSERRSGREALLWAAGAFCVQLVVLLPLLGVFLSTLQDEGLTATHATRVALGQVPFRDYYTRFMPGTDLLLGLAFKLLGSHLWVMRVYMLLSVSLLAAAIEWVGCRLLPRRWSELPALWFICLGAQVWPIAGGHWDAGLLAMLALGALSLRRDFWCGLLCGLAVVFLQTKGLAVCLGIGFTLLTQPRRLGRLFAGAALPGALFVGWLLALGIFAPFWQQTVVYSTSTYVATQSVPFSLAPLWEELAVLGQGLHNFGAGGLLAWSLWFGKALAFTVVDFVKYGGYYPVLVAGAVLAWRRRRDETLVALILVLLLASVFDLARPNRYRLNLQSPLWNLLLVSLLAGIPHRRARLVITGLILAAFVVHGLDNVTGWWNYRYPVAFERGVVQCDNPALADVLAHIDQDVARQAPADRSVFGFCEIPLITWLMGHPNPTRLDEALPLITPGPEIEQLGRDIEKVDVLLYVPLDPRLGGDYPRLRPEDVAREQERVQVLLTRGTRLVGGGSGLYQVYLRSGTR